MRSACALVALALIVIAGCSGDSEGPPMQSLSSGGPQTESLLHTVLQRGVLRVGTTGTYMPFSFLAPNGEYEGYDIDVANKLARDLGVRVKFVRAPWSTIVAGLVAGKYDIAASGISLTLDRLKTVAFSDSYVHTSFVALIRRSDQGKYKSWHDLNSPNLTIAVMLGTSAERLAKETFPRAKFITLVAPALDWEEVLAGHADASVSDNLTNERIASHNPELIVLDPDFPLRTEFDGIITNQGDQVWLNWLNTWIMLQKRNGFFSCLYKKWIVGTTEPQGQAAPGQAGDQCLDVPLQ
jgi:cyclohexadienyl dehydratase